MGYLADRGRQGGNNRSGQNRGKQEPGDTVLLVVVGQHWTVRSQELHTDMAGNSSRLFLSTDFKLQTRKRFVLFLN